MLDGREVVEYSAPNIRVWIIDGPGRLSGLAAAVKSPLSGGWLVIRGGHAEDGSDNRSWRMPTLREARRSVLGGNGRQRGGHPEVTRVREVMPGILRKMVAVI